MAELAVPPDDVALDDAARRVFERLRSFGDLQANVHTGSCAGDEDVRLVACRDHPVVHVELLCCSPAGVPLPCWYAVRTARGERCVWRGPDRGRPIGDVVRFVDDLLRMDLPLLAQRYERLS